MTAFDRLAWRCSWVAPAGLAAALVAVGIDAIATALGRASVNGWHALLVPLALGAGTLGGLAHLVVHYHAVKAGSFSNRVDRAKVGVAVHFNAYAKWRALMRSEHPELRPQSSREDRNSW